MNWATTAPTTTATTAATPEQKARKIDIADLILATDNRMT